MDGSCFKLHRDAVVKVFHDNCINEGVIIYFSPSQPKEPYSESELTFTQEALFFWLTGWNKPDSTILIDIATGRSCLSIPSYGEKYEIWTGPIPTTESIVKLTGVDEVANENIVDFFVSCKSQNIYIEPSQIREDLLIALTKLGQINPVDLLPAVGIARRVKFPHEVEALRTASQLTGKALVEVMKTVKPGMTEQDIEITFKLAGYKLGCKDVSFLTIAASGQNSVYLHYVENTGNVNDGDLVLLDCGLFYNHYAGDITRTFPANGKFSAEQKLVYGLLLEEQIKLVESVKVGVTFSELVEGLLHSVFNVCTKIGVVPEDAEYNYDVARLFCPHNISHHIGCNVHDQTYFSTKDSQIKDSYEINTTLVPNMIISIEPGIYFHRVRLERSKDDPKYSIVNFERALQLAKDVAGIRIEDDVLVTEDGREVLSSTCPKSIEEIEKLMAK